MKPEKISMVIGEKLGHPQGVRFFSSVEQAQRLADDPSKIITIAGLPAIWPDIAGPVPSDATLSLWETEYDAALEIEKKKQAALAALKIQQEQAALDAALSDPNAPQAVKDYKAVKK